MVLGFLSKAEAVVQVKDSSTEQAEGRRVQENRVRIDAAKAKRASYAAADHQGALVVVVGLVVVVLVLTPAPLVSFPRGSRFRLPHPPPPAR